jgi:hypothetical protein
LLARFGRAKKLFESEESSGEKGASSRTKKVKLWDKPRALEMAAKHLGLFERDNAQHAPSLALQVVLIGPP